MRAHDGGEAGIVQRLVRGRTVIGREPTGGHQLLTFRDPVLSRSHVELRVKSGADAVVLRDLNSRNGTFVGGRRVEQVMVSHGAIIRIGGLVMVLESDDGAHLAHGQATAEVPGRSALARKLRGQLALAALSREPVLICGPTGAGKESAASELHRRSARRGQLVQLNIAAIPTSLFEGELFGHAKGAFTGAEGARMGRIREADGGTLVLDEIGELPLTLQAKLLRTLDGQPIRPVGATADVTLDGRFVGTTNADLEALVKAGRFRQDLAARLRILSVELPALNDRKADLLDLADAVAPLERRDPVRWRDVLTPDAVEALLLCDWVDNLRGLKAALVHAAITSPIGEVDIHALPPRVLVRVRKLLAPQQSPATDGLDDTPHDLPSALPRKRQRPSADELDAALRRHEGVVNGVAREFGVHRNQVYRWFKYAGIDPDALEAYRSEG